jgi:hypothetical protein
MMLRKITLPCDLEVMAMPPLALITVAKTALAMTAAAIRCEHLNLDEYPLYFADGDLPPKSLSLAKTICERTEELINILVAYRAALDAEVSKLQKTADFPF